MSVKAVFKWLWLISDHYGRMQIIIAYKLQEQPIIEQFIRLYLLCTFTTTRVTGRFQHEMLKRKLQLQADFSQNPYTRASFRLHWLVLTYRIIIDFVSIQNSYQELSHCENFIATGNPIQL